MLGGRIRNLEQRARTHRAHYRETAERPFDVAQLGDHLFRRPDVRRETRDLANVVPHERAAPVAAERIAGERVHGLEHVGLSEPGPERLAHAHEHRGDLRLLLGVGLRGGERFARVEALEAAPLECMSDEHRRRRGGRKSHHEVADRRERALDGRERRDARADHHRRGDELRPDPPGQKGRGDQGAEETHGQRRIRIVRQDVRNGAAREHEREHHQWNRDGARARRRAAECADPARRGANLQCRNGEERAQHVTVDREVGPRERDHCTDDQDEGLAPALDELTDRLVVQAALRRCGGARG